MIAFTFLCVLLVALGATAIVCLAVLFRSDREDAQCFAIIAGIICAAGCIAIGSQVYHHALALDRRNHAEPERTSQPAP